MFYFKYIFTIILFCFATSTYAVPVYNNFPSDMSFDCCHGHGVGSTSDFELGMLFTPSDSGTLTNIIIAASTLGSNREIKFELYSNLSGGPGDVLESFRLSNLPTFNDIFQPQLLVSLGNIYLSSASSYWLVASQPNFPDIAVWNSSSRLESSIVAWRDSGFTDWVVAPHEREFSLQVNVASVPEPSIIFMFITGLLILLTVRFRSASELNKTPTR